METGVMDSSDSFDEVDHSSLVDEGVGASAREEIADFEGDVVAGVGVGADEDDSSDSFAEANHRSLVDECIGDSAREEITDFGGDVFCAGADEDDSDHSSVVDEGVGGGAREEIADFEGDNYVVEFQGETEEPWGEHIIDT